MSILHKDMSWGKLGFNEDHTASSLELEDRMLLSEKKKCNTNSCQLGSFSLLERKCINITSLEYTVGLSKFSLKIISQRVRY